MPELRPIEKFHDDVAPALLMLQVYRLLDSRDQLETDGDFVGRVRELIAASATEQLVVLQNELFVGIIRERADVPPRFLRTAFLCHLLRQAVVVSCTAFDSYLPALLRGNLPGVIRAEGRAIASNEQLKEYFSELRFTFDEVVRAREDGGALFIANKVLSFVQHQYLVGNKGIVITCGLLGIQNPWDELARRLDRDERDIKRTLRGVVDRRNDIVHRGDRSKDDPAGDPTTIAFSYANQGVETLVSVCHALDELVTERMVELARGDNEPR